MSPTPEIEITGEVQEQSSVSRLQHDTIEDQAYKENIRWARTVLPRIRRTNQIELLEDIIHAAQVRIQALQAKEGSN